MSLLLIAALLLGIAAGLRTFTAPAVLLLMHSTMWGGHARIAGVVLAVLAIAEYVGDLMPSAPARTTLFPMLARIVSGAFVGWCITAPVGAVRIAGLVLGIIGALAGAYGGVSLRLLAMRSIGALPAALTEDLVAIVLSVGVVAST